MHRDGLHLTPGAVDAPCTATRRIGGLVRVAAFGHRNQLARTFYLETDASSKPLPLWQKEPLPIGGKVMFFGVFKDLVFFH